MNLIHVVTFFHITFMMLALGMTVFPGILLQQIAAGGDVATIRNAFRIGMYHGRVGGMFVGIAVIFGFWGAALAHFPLSSGWLIAAYLVVVVLVAFGVAVHYRHEARIFEAASSGRADAGDECIGLAKSPTQQVLNSISGLIWLFAIYDMVAKPF